MPSLMISCLWFFIFLEVPLYQLHICTWFLRNVQPSFPQELDSSFL
jgi:hypothetical protein